MQDVLLNCDKGYVLHSLHMSHSNPVISLIFHLSYGTNLLPNIRRRREEAICWNAYGLTNTINIKKKQIISND